MTGGEGQQTLKKLNGARLRRPSRSIELIQPIAMDEGLRFAIREGGRTVGAGTVTKIVK